MASHGTLLIALLSIPLYSRNIVLIIPDNCHFFTLANFEAWKFYTQVRKFATKIASRQNSLHHRIRSKFHINSKITHFV